jgi:hypothetical protein
MTIYSVETYNTNTGEVVHGLSLNAATPEHARSRYMKQPERPHLTGSLDVRVVAL